MKATTRAILLMLMFCGLTCRTLAQIKATTQDGRKVILSLDGTWKYEIGELEKDSTLGKSHNLPADSVALRNAAINSLPTSKDSVSVKTPPPPPVIVRKPPNLECTALLAVQRSRDNEKFFAILKELPIASEGKTGFVISMQRTRNTPVVVTFHVVEKGFCVDEQTKIALVLSNGTVFKLENEAPANCTGDFKLNFGGVAGNDYVMELLQKFDIQAMGISNAKSHVDQSLHEYDAAIFKAAFNCIISLK